jgi:hypothetical protein
MAKLGAHIKTFASYVDFISVVVGCAPDGFIRREWETPEQHLDLDRAFTILREKFPLVEARTIDKEALPRMRELLEQSYQSYGDGEQQKGAHLIQAFEKLILESTKPRTA